MFSSWFRDFKLTAECFNRAFLDFAMAGKWGNFSIAGVFPNGMVATFANEKTTMTAQMAFYIKPFHEVAS